MLIEPLPSQKAVWYSGHSHSPLGAIWSQTQVSGLQAYIGERNEDRLLRQAVKHIAIIIPAWAW